MLQLKYSIVNQLAFLRNKKFKVGTCSIYFKF